MGPIWTCSAMHISPSRRSIAVVIIATLLLAGGPPVLAASAGPEDTDGAHVGGHAQGREARAQVKWTYLVYMSADNNLEDEAILNVNQMEMVGSDENLSIVIQLDRARGYDTSNGNWEGTRRYYVNKDANPAVINSELVVDMGEIDMGDGGQLRDFVVWGINNYPADRYYLDVWGHGGGWRDGTCNDYESGSVIDTDELGKAMVEARASTNVTLDGIGFDQCLMAQLEVFYEIKATANVLVGAESLIPSEGYNYTRVLRPLSLDPEMTASELGEVLVSAFFDEYGHANERAHSAADAEELDARLSPAVNRLAQLLKGVAATYHDEIKWARDHAQTYRTIDYIDLGNFTERLLEVLPENETELVQAAVEVRENVTTTVISEDHGIGRNGSTGISFYFPEYGPAWSYSRTALALEQRWDEFLDAYFDDRDRPNQAPTVVLDQPYPGSVVGLDFIMEGSATDPDGNVTRVEWKFDRDPWRSAEAGPSWSLNVSTQGLTTGPHRLSVRSRDNAGDYSPEVQFQVNVQSRGIGMSFSPEEARSFPGAELAPNLVLVPRGNESGTANLEVVQAPSGWTVTIPVKQRKMTPTVEFSQQVQMAIDASTPLGAHHVLVRAWMEDAPLVQAFAWFRVNVTARWPDLFVHELSLSSTEPSVGESVTINMSVANLGHANAFDFDIELRYQKLADGTGEGDIILLDTLHVPVLNAGSLVRFSSNWEASLGVHMFTVVADPAGNNSDLVQEDNRRSTTLRLEGHDFKVGIDRTVVRTTAGGVETVLLNVTNTGNLVDIVQLSITESPPRWRARLNETFFMLQPREMENASLEVVVPEDVLGGTKAKITILARSLNDEELQRAFTIWIVVPETYQMDVTQDAGGALLDDMGTVSFNITVGNMGNGFENYTLDYVHQTKDLLVTAVNDSLEVGPGCSTRVEVFISSLGTSVGGESFDLRFTVRSVDDAATVAVVDFNVTVRRSSELRAWVSPDYLTTGPGGSLDFALTVVNEGNYQAGIHVAILGDAELFSFGSLLGEILEGGEEVTFNLYPSVKRDVHMGDYHMVLHINEVEREWVNTTVMVPVTISRLDSVSFSFNGSTEGPLGPDDAWSATMLLVNEGNHPESFDLAVSGAKPWMVVGLSAESVALPAHGSYVVELTVTMGSRDVRVDSSFMLAVTATPFNSTDTTPTVIIDMPVRANVGGDDPGSTWLGWMTLALVMAVILITVVIFRRWR